MDEYVVGGDVHTNSGIPNKAAYLMINGGTFHDVTVQGLGRTKVARIYYDVLVNHRLTSTAQFIDLRYGALEAASAIYGSSSQEYQSVSAAFDAVGIVNPPPIPSLVSPANASTGISTNPTLRWNASTGATSYRLQISTNSNFSTIIFDRKGITGTSQQVSGLASNTLYYWRVNATSAGGTSNWSSVWKFTTTGSTSVEQVDSDIPETYALYQNYPNPFNSTTTIKFSIPKESFVKLTIFNSLGMEIENLVNETLTPGYYRIQWNPWNIPSGVYFYQLNSSEFTDTKKLLLLK
jgi:hypothetical protein